ncbi:MAG: hypothetical protein U9N12_01895 [Euryarchaeota archaeon]|nr:hypothetical protein [Euryarchaeota archaeon]
MRTKEAGNPLGRLAKNKRILMLCAAFLLLVTPGSAYSEIVPPNIFEFTRDYYNVFGEPLLSASVIGASEFERGEKSKIVIRLVNEGRIDAFETEKMPGKFNESRDAKTELELEYDVTTATNICGTLENRNAAPIRIFSGLQYGGFLRSGERSQPLEFDIEVFRNATSGVYELVLNLTYQYQNEVAVDGYPDQEFDYWYVTRNQTLPIHIGVEPGAVFEVEGNASSRLLAGRAGVLYIVYRNVGSIVAEDAVASIGVADPFETTDDQAFLGVLYPGDAYEAKYWIDVDSDALPKTYGIETEVRYTDRHGDTRISDMMTAPVTVVEPIPLCERMGPTGYSVVIAVIAVIVVIAGVSGLYIYKKRGKTDVR